MFERVPRNGTIQESMIDLTISLGIMIWDIDKKYNM